MKNCPHCGSLLDDNAGFCAACGGAQPQQPQQNYGYTQQPQQNYGYTQQQPQQNYGYAQQPQQNYGYTQQPQQNYGYSQQQNYNYTQLQQPAYGYTQPQVYQRPVGMLSTNRGLLKFILLSMITFGIYGLVVMSGISSDINTIASRYDGRKTMHFCLLLFIIGPITFGIGFIVWSHRISDRIGNELKRRLIPYSFGASDYWLWNVLGSLIIVGPFVYMYKMLKSMNMLCENYNMFG